MKTRLVPIENLGKNNIQSPLCGNTLCSFIKDNENVVFSVHQHEIENEESGNGLTYFELAGPREKLYFDPKKLVCGIITCGGLCPGLNDVIQAIVDELYSRYGVKKILGFKYGYLGLTKRSPVGPVDLIPDQIDDLHRLGGTILGSSRGDQDIEEMVETLKKNKVQVLFTIGGDGTMRGASKIAEYIKEKGLDIAVIAVPKTIDNDIFYVSKSFGFNTAVAEADKVVACANTEAEGAPNCIGLVKVMGRHSGFIAAHVSMANRDVNYCLVPEVPFKLEGEGGLLEVLDKRLKKKGHAVIVVAEGAGQDLMASDPSGERVDASGNVRLKDIGVFLKEKIQGYFISKDFDMNIKYIDPSYIIRSVPADSGDSTYCLLLGQNAAHAAMAGKTNTMVGYWNHHVIHVPISMAIEGRKKVLPEGRLWKTVMESTLQPESLFNLS